MNRGATLKDVAREAGVAVATASYALSGKGTIADETRRRVQEASQALGYRPNPHAQRLRQAAERPARTGNLGVVLVESRPQDPIYLPLVQRFSEQVQARERHPLVLACNTGMMHPDELPFTLRQRHLDGFLLNGVLDDDLLSLVRRLGLPFVVLGNHRVAPQDSIVRLEVSEGILQGMEHLLALGHRRIGVVSEVLDSPYQRDILRGYEEALATAGLSPEPELIQASGARMAGGHAPTERLLKLPSPPTAVMVTDYRIAGDVARTAERSGLRIGRELSIVTMAGQHETAFRPRLTCVRDQIDSMVDLGLRALDALLDDPNHPPYRASVPCRLDTGDSSGPLL